MTAERNRGGAGKVYPWMFGQRSRRPEALSRRNRRALAQNTLGRRNTFHMHGTLLHKAQGLAYRLQAQWCQ